MVLSVPVWGRSSPLSIAPGPCEVAAALVALDVRVSTRGRRVDLRGPRPGLEAARGALESFAGQADG